MNDEKHEVIDTAIVMRDLRDGTAPNDAISYGVEDAVEILKERGDLDLEDRASSLSFARAVHEVLVHHSLDDTNLYEGPRDIARGVLAAWSLDQIREFHSGRDVREDHDRFVRDIGGYDENIPAVDDDRSILDARVWSATSDAVLANASLPTEMRDGLTAWEMRLDDLGRIDDVRDFRPLNGSSGHDMSSAHDVPMDAAVDAVNARVDHSMDVVLRDEPSYEDAVRIASDARRSFPDELTSLQEGLLAAEAIQHGPARREFGGLQDRMGENALARIIARGDADGLSAQDVARVIVVDMSIMMVAQRAVRDGTEGGHAQGMVQPFDRVLADLAGTDPRRDMDEMRSPDRASTLPMSQGRFSAVPDASVRESVSESLEAARKPFSKSLENAIGIKLAVQKGERDRATDMALGAPTSLRNPRSVTKGPASPVLTHGMMRGAGAER